MNNEKLNELGLTKTDMTELSIFMDEQEKERLRKLKNETDVSKSIKIIFDYHQAFIEEVDRRKKMNL